jgi:hypothetical protein
LVYSIHDPTEVAIKKKVIEASQKMINKQNNNPAVNRHFKLQIKTLQNAPRDADKLELLLKVKERQKEEAMHMEDIQRLVTEIEMLKVVYCIWCAEIEEKLARRQQKSKRKYGKWLFLFFVCHCVYVYVCFLF